MLTCPGVPFGNRPGGEVIGFANGEVALLVRNPIEVQAAEWCVNYNGGALADEG